MSDLENNLTLLEFSGVLCWPKVDWALVTSFRVLPGSVVDPFRRTLTIPVGPDPVPFSRVLELSDFESSSIWRTRCGGMIMQLGLNHPPSVCDFPS